MEPLPSARELLAKLLRLRSNVVDHLSLSEKSKLPGKAITIREALLYRVTELGEAACSLYENKKFVSAFILTRSALETAALLYYVHKNLLHAVDSGTIDDDVDVMLMKALLGSKKGSNRELEAVNILTVIEHLSKKVPHAQRTYDTLSEVAHPNYAGALYMYSRADAEKMCTHFDPFMRSDDAPDNLGMLCASLLLFLTYYDEITRLMPAFITLAEKQIEELGN